MMSPRAFLCFTTSSTIGGVRSTVHSVRVAHNHLIGPREWRAVDGIITIN
jgi:uncharacterized protein Usg